MNVTRLLLACIFLSSATVHAQESVRDLLRSESRSLQRGLDDERRGDIRLLKAERDNRTRYSATLGVTYADVDGGGHGVNIPFLLAATLPGGTDLKLTGEGYTWDRLPDARRTGFADIDAFVLHKFTAKLRLGAGVRVATGSQASGDAHGFFLLARYDQPVARQFSVSGTAKVLRDLDGPREASRRTAHAGALQLTYTPTDPSLTRISSKLTRVYRPNAGGGTELSLGSEWKLAADLATTVTFVRGIAGLTRESRLGVDFTKEF
jgi:hypothetical protein